MSSYYGDRDDSPSRDSFTGNEVSRNGPVSQSGRRSIFARSNSARVLDSPRMSTYIDAPKQYTRPALAHLPPPPAPDGPVTYPAAGYVPKDVPRSAAHAVSHWHKTRRACNTYLWMDLSPVEGRLRGINIIIRFYVDDGINPNGTRGYSNRRDTPIDPLATGHYGRFALESLTQFFYGVGEHARYLYSVKNDCALQLHYEDWVRADVRLLLLEFVDSLQLSLFTMQLLQWVGLSRMRFVEREVGHWTRTWTDTKVRRVLEHGSLVNIYDHNAKQTVWLMFDQAGIRTCRPEDSIRIEDIVDIGFKAPDDTTVAEDDAAATAEADELAKTQPRPPQKDNVDEAKEHLPASQDTAPGALALVQAGKRVRSQGYTVIIKTVNHETGAETEFSLIAMSEPAVLEWLFRLKDEVNRYNTNEAESAAAAAAAMLGHAEGADDKRYWWDAFEKEEADQELKACNVLLNEEDMVLVGPARSIDPPEVARFKRARWSLSEETRLAVTMLSKGVLMRLHSPLAPPTLLIIVVRHGRLAWLSPANLSAPFTAQNSVSLETVTKVMLGKQTANFTFTDSAKSIAPERCCSICFTPLAAIEPPSTASAAHLQRIALATLNKSLAAGELCLEASSEADLLEFLTHFKVLTDEIDIVTAGFRIAQNALNDDARSMLTPLYAGTEFIWSATTIQPIPDDVTVLPHGVQVTPDGRTAITRSPPQIRRVLFRSGRLYFCNPDHYVSLSSFRALCHGLHLPFQRAIGQKQLPPGHSWSILYDRDHNHFVMTQGLVGIETLTPVNDYTRAAGSADKLGISAFSGCVALNVEFASRETFINWHEGFKVLLSDSGVAVSHAAGALDRKTGPIYTCLPRRQQWLRDSAMNGVRFLAHASSTAGAGTNGGHNAAVFAPPTKSILYCTHQALLWGALGESLSLRHLADVWAGPAPAEVAETQTRAEISTEHIEIRKVNKVLGRKSGPAALALAEAEAAARCLPGDSKRVRRQRLQDALAANRQLDAGDRLSLLIEEQCILDGKLTVRKRVLRLYAIPGAKDEAEAELEKDSKVASAASLAATLARAREETEAAAAAAAEGLDPEAAARLKPLKKALTVPPGGRPVVGNAASALRGGDNSESDEDRSDDDDDDDMNDPELFFARQARRKGGPVLRPTINSGHPAVSLAHNSHLGGWVLALHDAAVNAHAAALSATRDMARVKFRAAAKWHKYQDMPQFAPLFQGVVMNLHRGDGPGEPRLVFLAEGRICVESPDAAVREAGVNSFSVESLDVLLGKQSAVFLRTQWGAAARDICCFTILCRDDCFNEIEINLEMGSPVHLQHYIDCLETFMRAESCRVIRSEEPSAFPEAPMARFISFLPENAKLTARGAMRQRLHRLISAGTPFILFDGPNSSPQEVLLFVRNNALVWVPKQNRIPISAIEAITLTKTAAISRNPYAASADAFECAALTYEEPSSPDRIGELHVEAPGHITKLHSWFLGLHLALERAGVVVAPESHSAGGLLGFRQWSIAPPIESHTAISGPGEVLTALPTNESFRLFVDCSRIYLCGAEVGRQAVTARTIPFRDLIAIHIGSAATAFDAIVTERHNTRLLREEHLRAQAAAGDPVAAAAVEAMDADPEADVKAAIEGTSLIDSNLLDVRTFSLQYLDPMYRAVTIGFLASSHAQMSRVLNIIISQVKGLGFQVVEPSAVRLPGTRISIWSPKRVHINRDLMPPPAALGAPFLSSPAQYLRALLSAPLRELFRGRDFTGITITRDGQVNKTPISLFYDGQDRVVNAARGAFRNDGTLTTSALGAYDDDDEWTSSGSSLTHGKLYWCSVGRREQIPGCSLALRDIKHVYVGKQTPAFVSAVAMDLNPTCCFSLVTDTDTVDVCAPNPHVMRIWLQALLLALNASSIVYGLRVPNSKTLLLSPTPAAPHAMHPAVISLQSRLLQDVIDTELASPYDETVIHSASELSAVARASATHVLATAMKEPLTGAHAMSLSAALDRGLDAAAEEAILSHGVSAVSIDYVFAPTVKQRADAEAGGYSLNSFTGVDDIYEPIEARREVSEAVQVFYLPDADTGSHAALYSPLNYSSVLFPTKAEADAAGSGDWGGALYWCRAGLPRRCIPSQCVPICALTEIRVSNGAITFASPVLRGRLFQGILRLASQDHAPFSAFGRAVSDRWRRVPPQVKARAVALGSDGTLQRYAAEAATLAFSLTTGLPGSASVFGTVEPDDVFDGRGASELIKFAGKTAENAAAAAELAAAAAKGEHLDLADDEEATAAAAAADEGVADAEVAERRRRYAAAADAEVRLASSTNEAGSVFAVSALDCVPTPAPLFNVPVLEGLFTGLFTTEFPFGPPAGDVIEIKVLEDDASAGADADDAVLALALEKEARARWDAAQTALEEQRALMLEEKLRRDREEALIAAAAEEEAVEEDEDDEWLAEEDMYVVREEEADEEEDEDEEDIWVKIARRAEAAKQRVHARARKQLAEVVAAAEKGKIVPLPEIPADELEVATSELAAYHAKKDAEAKARGEDVADESVAVDGHYGEGEGDAAESAAPSAAGSLAGSRPVSRPPSRPASRADLKHATKVPDVDIDEDAGTVSVPQTVYRDAWQIGLLEAEEEEKVLEGLLNRARRARMAAQARLAAMQEVQAKELAKQEAERVAKEQADRAAAAAARAAALADEDEDEDDYDDDDDDDDDDEESEEEQGVVDAALASALEDNAGQEGPAGHNSENNAE